MNQTFQRDGGASICRDLAVGPGRKSAVIIKRDTAGEFAQGPPEPGIRLPGGPILPRPWLVGRRREFASSISPGEAAPLIDLTPPVLQGIPGRWEREWA